MTVRRLVAWIGGGTLLAVVAWSVLQPTTVAKAGLDRLMGNLVLANRPVPALYSIEGDGPPLGAPFEWYVVASDGHELARIDLVDGDVDGYGLAGYPQSVVGAGRAGAELVLAGPAPQPVYAVSIHDPAGPRRELFRWPLDARDPVNAAYYAVERIDDGTVRVGHLRLDGIELVRAVVDIDLTSGRRRPAPIEMETGGSSRWLDRWIGKPTAATGDGEIIAGPASEKRRQAVLIRRRDGDSFYNPVAIPLRFRPEKVMLIPKRFASTASPVATTTIPPASTTTTTTSSPEDSPGDARSVEPGAAEASVPDPPVPAAVLQDLNSRGHRYLIAGNHRSFHRIDLATGEVDRFDLGLRVVGVVSSAGDAGSDRAGEGSDGSGGAGAGGAELIAINPGSAVVALAADEPMVPARLLLSLRSNRAGADRSTTVRVVPAQGEERWDIEYWDRSGSSGSWRRLGLDFAAGGPASGPYLLAPTDAGVAVTDERSDERYVLPISIAGGVSTVLLA